MERDIFDSVKEKDFSALTPEERAELADICSNEFEFNQLKAVFSQVETMKNEHPTPKKETKAKLDDLFVQTYPKVAPIWYNGLFAIVVPREKPLYRQPLAQIAAIALIAFFTVPYFNQSMPQEKVQMAEVKKQIKGNTFEAKEAESRENRDETVLSSESTKEATTRAKMVDDSVEKPALVASTATSSSASAKVSVFAEGAAATAPGSDHPDGIFMGEQVSFSQPASESPGIFDLLTTSF